MNPQTLNLTKVAYSVKELVELLPLGRNSIYEAVKAVMPEFRRDFATISQRVAKLQPWLDRAHNKIMAADLEIERLPFL